MDNKVFFREIIFKSTGKYSPINNIRYQGGGCINNAAIVESGSGIYFIKYNEHSPPDMFEKEYQGLLLLQQSKIIQVPEPLGYGAIGNINYLLLEVINSAKDAADFWVHFGSTLARLHREIRSGKYGLACNNFIGRLPQINSWKADWIDFFIELRLDFQLQLAIRNNLISPSLVEKFHRLYKLLPELLPVEKPSLVHGDLWSGNFMTGNDGRVRLIDPAVYFGHREAEISFTKMFGGFDDRFYQAYADSWPLEKGFDDRIDIYNLYPSLVHLNLFGAMYLDRIKSVLENYD